MWDWCFHISCSFFLLALQVGNNRSIEDIDHYYWQPGENLGIVCYLSPGPQRIFCRENCQGENVLLNTTSNKAARGRSSIEYSERVHDKSYNLTVRVSNLTLSDLGLYRCGLTDSPFSPDNKFMAVVAEGEFLIKLLFVQKEMKNISVAHRAAEVRLKLKLVEGKHETKPVELNYRCI